MLIIEYLDEEIPVYDITVEDNHNFYGNDILVHNCVEITLPTTPFDSMEDLSGEIALCILGAINFGVITKDELERLMELQFEFLDNIIDIQNYPVKQSMKMLKRRSLGVGINNLAYFFAKNKVEYGSKESLELLDEWVSNFTYYGIKASVGLAEKRGACEYYNLTKYSKGLLPIDTYNKNVDLIIGHQEYDLDWNLLREELKKYGIRNSTGFAIMPAESCVSKETKIHTKDGIKSYEDILTEDGIDFKSIELEGKPKWIEFNKKIEVLTQNGYETSERVYYNGKKEVFDIEFEDGKIYKMTGNHKLLVNRNGNHIWTRCDELEEGDNIVNINL